MFIACYKLLSCKDEEFTEKTYHDSRHFPWGIPNQNTHPFSFWDKTLESNFHDNKFPVTQHKSQAPSGPSKKYSSYILDWK